MSTNVSICDDDYFADDTNSNVNFHITCNMDIILAQFNYDLSYNKYYSYDALNDAIKDDI
jgi:hypothetical protein